MNRIQNGIRGGLFYRDHSRIYFSIIEIVFYN